MSELRDAVRALARQLEAEGVLVGETRSRLDRVCRAVGVANPLKDPPPPRQARPAGGRPSKKAAIEDAREASFMVKMGKGGGNIWRLSTPGMGPGAMWEGKGLSHAAAREALIRWRLRYALGRLTGCDDLPSWVDDLRGGLEERLTFALERLREESYAGS